MLLLIEAYGWIIAVSSRLLGVSRRVQSFPVIAIFLLGLVVGQVEAPQDLIVELGSTQAVPGTQAIVPLVIYLEEESPTISEITARVCVSQEFVDFIKLEPGFGAQKAEAEVTGQWGEKGQACVPLTVQVSFVKPPETGTVANLVFQIKSEAPVDQSIRLEGEYRITLASGETRDALPSTGEIQVVEVISIFACFLYMH